ncbi:MAG TPA: hypothetical protein VNT79_01200 [Phycisphaerae bacterium]|nr:hypothetical protein [Phycisphaerae bacterium]
MGITTNQSSAPVFVDQAVFTSIRSPMGEGYRIVTASPGVRPEEKAEITRRAPSHAALCDGSESAAGMMAFILTSGRHCVGFSCHAGKEHTGRGGLRVYSHFVLLNAEEFARFGSHAGQIAGAARSAVADALVLKQAATAGKLSLAFADPLTGLSFKKSGVDQIKQILGIARLMMSDRPGAVALCQDGVRLIDAALTCVPAAIRARFALSAGVRYSPSRQLQFCLVNPDGGETQRALRGQTVALVDCLSSDICAGRGPFDAWFEFVNRKVNAGAWDTIAHLTARLAHAVTPERLGRVVRMCDDLVLIQGADAADLELIRSRWDGIHVDFEPELSLFTKLRAGIERRLVATTPALKNHSGLPEHSLPAWNSPSAETADATSPR